jgi:hypothetical protein
MCLAGEVSGESWFDLQRDLCTWLCRFIRDRWRIARGYFRYWFWIDAVSSVSSVTKCACSSMHAPSSTLQLCVS